MSADGRTHWRHLSREAGLRPAGDTIEVRFGDGRRQTVYVEEHEDDTIRLWSIVARPAALRQLRTPQLDAWHRNRLSELVGFALDRRGRMLGEAWVPPGELAPEEWAFYVTNLAKACDRYEYLLTGRDDA